MQVSRLQTQNIVVASPGTSSPRLQCSTVFWQALLQCRASCLISSVAFRSHALPVLCVPDATTKLSAQGERTGGTTMVGWWDLFIALAYFCIPLELAYCFAWYPFRVRFGPAAVGVLFISFITLCGGTHLVRCEAEQSMLPC